MLFMLFVVGLYMKDIPVETIYIRVLETSND